MIKNLLIKVEYEGTRYKGWQVQPDQATVQCEITKVFERICRQKAHIMATSRTDSGVHARGQVATVKIPSHISLRKLFISANALLPDDIAITDLVQVDINYSARFDSQGKRYLYKIVNSPIQEALNQSKTLWVKQPLDLDLMASAVSLFKGTHNFGAFQGRGCQQPRTTKTISEITIQYDQQGLYTWVELMIEGSGFLKNMIRIMVGTLLEIGRHKRTTNSITHALKTQKREDAGITAPPKGLILDEVFLQSDPFSSRNGPAWDNE